MPDLTDPSDPTDRSDSDCEHEHDYEHELEETMPKRISFGTLHLAKGVGAPIWSPDGHWVAFTLGETLVKDNKGRTRVWVMSADGKEIWPLTNGLKSDGTPASDTFPRWSPDGRTVAFYSNRSGSTQIWVIHPFGGEAMPLTDERTGCGPLMTDGFFAGLEWSPDGQRIAFVAQLPEPKKKPVSDVKVVGVEYGEGYSGVNTRMHVWTIGAEGGKARRVTRGDFHHGDPRWSPDGRWIAFVSNRTRDEEAVTSSINKNYDLWLIPSQGGRIRKLTANPGPDYSPRWSPDGKQIAYLACPRCGSHSDVFNLCVLEVRTGASRVLTQSFPYSIDRPSAQCWLPDGRALIVSAGIRTENHLFLVSARDGRLTPLTRGRKFVSAPVLSPNGKQIAVLRAGERRLSEIEIRPVKSEKPTARTRFSDWLRTYALGDSRVVRWKSDEFTVEGAVVMPPGYRKGRRYPTIVVPHGGPHGRVGFPVNLTWQLLAAQGFIVFSPNFRGSTCYGQAFIDADRADFGGGDFRDIMSGLDKLVEDGIADPDRLGICGASYGGYMTTWSVGNTDRFKAAVAVCGVTNLQSMFGTTDIKSWTTWEFGGYPWESFETIVRCSPITYVANVKTPVLILHGEDDIRVPISQSEEFYSALKARGVKTQFVRYPKEGHAISQPQHVEDQWKRTLEWLKRHLKVGRRPRR
jgi:dipeptidyl aminopeptidase/acylaminoacyl peptidase